MNKVNSKFQIQNSKGQKIKTKNAGFTLIEILIVVALVAILAIIALLLLNPTRQRQKIYDVQRKRDLSQLKSLYDDYYQRKFEYPRGEDICYDTPVNNGGVCSCNICGLQRNPDTFKSIINVLYCDPEQPNKSYLYEYDCVNSTPQWYKIYAHLSGITPNGGSNGSACNYGVTNRSEAFLTPLPFVCDEESGGGGGPTATPGGGGGSVPTNTPVPTSPPAPTSPSCPADPIPKYCILGTVCNICGDTANCHNPGSCNQPLQLYSNSLCTNQCE